MDEASFVNESFGGGGYTSGSFVPEGRKMKGRGLHSGDVWSAYQPPPDSARAEQYRLRENAKWEELWQKKRAELEAKRRAAILEREKVRTSTLTSHESLSTIRDSFSNFGAYVIVYCVEFVSKLTYTPNRR